MNFENALQQLCRRKPAQRSGGGKIKRIPDGIEISRPISTLWNMWLEWWDSPDLISFVKKMPICGFWLVISVGLTVSAVTEGMNFFSALLRGEFSFVTVFEGLFLILFWAAFAGIPLYSLAETLGRREKIALSGSQMRIGEYFGGIGKGKAYDLAGITNLRMTPHTDQAKGRLCFEYQGQTIHCGKALPDADVKNFIRFLEAILAFRCHAVEHIVFGSSQVLGQDPVTVLHNPDVSELTFPFFHLQQISIYAESYNFHLVERFLTYAVNHIGQDYLQEHIEVHIYGDPEQLQPNLRNSLTNLCKEVHLYESFNSYTVSRQSQNHAD